VTCFPLEWLRLGKSIRTFERPLWRVGACEDGSHSPPCRSPRIGRSRFRSSHRNRVYEMSTATRHCLDGLEPDNLLAFLALLGLLRSLEARDSKCPDDQKLHPRAAWETDAQPLRPVLYVALASTPQHIAEAAAQGIDFLAADHEFQDRKDLNYCRQMCREIRALEAESASVSNRSRPDLFAALMSAAASTVA